VTKVRLGPTPGATPRLRLCSRSDATADAQAFTALLNLQKRVAMLNIVVLASSNETPDNAARPSAPPLRLRRAAGLLVVSRNSKLSVSGGRDQCCRVRCVCPGRPKQLRELGDLLRAGSALAGGFRGCRIVHASCPTVAPTRSPTRGRKGASAPLRPASMDARYAFVARPPSRSGVGGDRTLHGKRSSWVGRMPLGVGFWANTFFAPRQEPGRAPLVDGAKRDRASCRSNC